MKKELKRLIAMIVMLAIMGIIFYFSSQVASVSSEVSESVLERVLSLIGLDDLLYQLQHDPLFTQTALGNLLIFMIRKAAHFTIYAVLAVSAMFVFYYSDQSMRNILFYSLLICLLYACSDEIHQLFVEGRSGELRDVVLDFMGACTGSFIFVIGYKIKDCFKVRRSRN